MIRSPARALLLGVAVSWASGCEPCVALEDVPLIDAEDEHWDAWADTVAMFRSWVDTDGLCLTHVRVLPAFEDVSIGSDHGGPAAGMYLPGNRSIRIQANKMEAPAPGADLLHELCHALDFQRGHLSNGMSFPPFIDGPSEWAKFLVYPEAHWDREMFAILCSEGPEINDLAAALGPGCGAADVANSARGCGSATDHAATRGECVNFWARTPIIGRHRASDIASARS